MSLKAEFCRCLLDLAEQELLLIELEEDIDHILAAQEWRRLTIPRLLITIEHHDCIEARYIELPGVRFIEAPTTRRVFTIQSPTTRVKVIQ